MQLGFHSNRKFRQRYLQFCNLVSDIHIPERFFIRAVVDCLGFFVRSIVPS